MKHLSRNLAAVACVIAFAQPLAALSSPMYLYSGSFVTAKINQTVDSGSAHVGDRFTMNVEAPYPSHNTAYEGAKLYGHVTHVIKADQGRNPELAFAIDRMVLPSGREAAVQMMIQSQETQRHNNFSNIAIGAAAGMILGNMLGKTLFRSNMGATMGMIAGALYGYNRRTNVSLVRGSTVVMEARRTVAFAWPSTTAYRH